MVIENYKNFLKKHNLPDTFCLYPWMHIDFDESGKILSCCRGKHNYGDWKSKKLDIDEWSSNISKLKQSMMSGVWDSNCIDCKKKESVGNQSLRHDIAIHAMRHIGLETIENEIIPNIKEDSQSIKFVELRPSNICNLQCIHCNDNSSSKWASFFKNNPEFLENNKINPTSNKFLSKSGYENIKDFIGELDDLSTIQFSGGEPLYDKDALNYIKAIPNPENVHISYITNGQTLPSDEMISEWKSFKEIHLSISVDAFHDQYDYFRYPGKWDILISNIDILKSISNITVHIPINIFTLFSIGGFIDVCENNNIKVHYSTVHAPEHLSITVLPRELKDKLNDTFKSRIGKIRDNDIKRSFEQLYQYINNYMYSSDDFESQKENLITYTSQLDIYRDLTLEHCCPELFNFLKETNK